MGLSSEYKNQNSEVGRWLNHLFGLTFLSPEEVGECFVEDFMSDKPDGNEKLNQFVDYLVDNYIDDDSLFPPTVWAERTGNIFRTTNACESFHSKFKKTCSSPHPNINVFIDALKDIQTDTYIIINSVNTNVRRLIKKNVLNKQKFINNKIVQYENNKICRYDFVRCVSFQFNHVVSM